MRRKVVATRRARGVRRRKGVFDTRATYVRGGSIFHQRLGSVGADPLTSTA